MRDLAPPLTVVREQRLDTSRLALQPKPAPLIPADPYRAGYRFGQREGFMLGVIATLLAVALVLAAAFVVVGL